MWAMGRVLRHACPKFWEVPTGRARGGAEGFVPSLRVGGGAGTLLGPALGWQGEWWLAGAVGVPGISAPGEWISPPRGGISAPLGGISAPWRRIWVGCGVAGVRRSIQLGCSSGGSCKKPTGILFSRGNFLPAGWLICVSPSLPAGAGCREKGPCKLATKPPSLAPLRSAPRSWTRTGPCGWVRGGHTGGAPPGGM